MGHKHKRAREVNNGDDFDLPPSVIARPLPVGKLEISKAKRKPRQTEWRNDDTPKAFTRLMQFQKRGKAVSGLDNGDAPRGRKRKRGEDSNAERIHESLPANVPKILPGERLGDFAARVDQALPFAGLGHKGKHVEGIKERETKHNRRLRKMQTAWREEEARIREKEAEARELAEEEEDERDALFGNKTVDLQVGGKKSRRKPDADDDPWEVLKRNREQPKGLHDVAQAPPQFSRVPKEKFKIRNGAKANVADIPNAAGSLRRREELGETRKTIIESYRRIMDGKRANS
ncbi:hypothetical protein NA57DRAFT_70114 [Rhizodiscina lignyota]|uniref:Uncharacterized protein n=1 Tax=Rhizodiscina lignyota TaxID=1504668 RepID=A0A9P4IMK9_9PEZI|nr:hypothetical protein NA57DRAFT_70114 [Rhizodiscina lignyota]